MSLLSRLGMTNAPADQPAAPAAPAPAAQGTPAPAPAGEAGQLNLDHLFTPSDDDHKTANFDPQTLFSDVDSSQLSDAFKSVNIVESVLTPAHKEAIQAGGDEAWAAMLQVMNSSAQRSAEVSTQMAAALVKKALAEAAPHVDQQVNNTIRTQSMEAAIKESNPIFKTPAASFMVDKLKEVFAAKHPNATSAEWRDMAAKFADQLASTAAPTQSTPEVDSTEQDWANFVERVL